MPAAVAFRPSAREEPISAGGAAQANWALLDDPAEWSAFGRSLEGEPATGRWESQVVVEGMHCAACAFTVEGALASVQGVEKAEVNAATRRARIVWSAAAVKPSR
ncbi:heavy-metal-associated domain-containing protein, partial [Variovorax sp. WDL1]